MRPAIRALGAPLIFAVILGACGGAAAPSPSPKSTPAPVAVSIKGFAFNPATLEVATGTLVTWTNEDAAPHTVTTGTPPPSAPPTASPSPGAPTPTRAAGPSPSLPKGDGRISSDRIEKDKTFSFTFTQAGTYEYFCAVHPRMTAKVTVK